MLPVDVRDLLLHHEHRSHLLEVVLDLGRCPEARFGNGIPIQCLRKQPVSDDDLEFASKFKDKLNSLTVSGTTYKRTEEERSKVIDRFNQAKLNKPISKQALKRWFTDEYLNDHPEIYDQFIKILTKDGEDHLNFLKAYKLFADYQDDINIIKNIKTKTLVMTGSDDSGSTVQMSKSLSDDLTNSSFIEINNGKHLCSIECADDVNINLKNFINN